jgi:hypothetical protein
MWCTTCILLARNAPHNVPWPTGNRTGVLRVKFENKKIEKIEKSK